MQLFSRKKAFLAVGLGALTALGACGDNVTVPVAPDSPVVVAITPPSAMMNIGEKLNFAVQITGGSKTATPTLASCTSSNTAVATVAVSGSACAVTAVSAGNVSITAAASTGGTAAASVTVAAQAAAISGLTLSPSAATVAMNQKVTIVPTVNRAAPAVAVAYTYASSAAAVASVDAAGVVTAVAPGTASITVTAAGTGTGFTSATLNAAATITVTALPSGLSAVSVTPSTTSIQQGRTQQLAFSATQPSGAPAATWVFGTTAPAVATVDATGNITAVAPGTAVITVTGNSAANSNFAAASASAQVQVTVTALPAGLSAVSIAPATMALATGKTQQLVPSATQPSGAPAATYSYASSATSVATVSATGLVTAVAPGTAVITVSGSSAANANFAAGAATATATVTVTALPSGITSLSVDATSATLGTGKTRQILASVNQPSGAATAAVTYGTSAPGVATVSASGVISAVSVGSAVITVTATSAANGDFAAATQTAQINVSVVALPTGLTAVSVVPGTSSLMQGKTLQLSYTATQPTGAAAATWTFGTTAPAVATVSATGLVTAVAPGTAVITATASSAANGDFSAASMSAQTTITVTALPNGLTSVTITPATLTLAVGANGQVTASAQGLGASSATISYASSNAAVATVSATGTVTAVGPGSATITATATTAATGDYAAATVSSTMAVTVSPRAAVSIASIVTAAGDPINVNNVAGQIGVDVAIVGNGQNVSSAQVFICAQGATCPAVGQTPAAQQQFGAGGAADGTIRMLINTAEFDANWTAGTATPRQNNGQNVVVATITTSDATGSATSNLAILNFNNTDGWVARHVAPTRTVLASNNSSFFGGPGATGQGTVTFAPVLYNTGKAITAFTARVSTQGTCGAAGTNFTSADARPWTITYGAFAAPTAKQVNCAYQTPLAGPADIGAEVTVSTINNVEAGPVATVGTFLTTTTNTNAVAQPAVIRVDYVAPAGYTYTLLAGTNAVAGWVNATYNLASQAGNIGGLADVGVGLPAARLIEVRGCGNTSWTALTTNTGADIAECGTDFGPTAYEARFTASDLLSNTGAVTVSAQRFGVDKTNPQIRYAATTDASGTIYGGAGLPADNAAADTIFSAQAIDERSGLLAAGSFYAQARTNAAAATCLTGAPAAGIGATPQTAPNCNFAAGAYGAATPDGWRQLTGGVLDVNNGGVAQTQGYYTYQPRVIDQAGNTTTLADVRSVLIQYDAPAAVTPTALPITTFPVTATSAITFAGTVTDGIEASLGSFRLDYGAAGIFAFSASAIPNTTFDNIIPGFGTGTTGQSALSGSTPFASGTRIYTSIEAVDGADAIVGAGGVNSALAGYGFFANNFGGAAGTANTAAIGGAVTPDNTLWSAKATNAATFVVAASAAGFNAPAGGLKAQITSTLAQINSPVSRVDFYITNGAGVNEYVATLTPDCDPASATRNCYIADIGVVRTWTYRYTGTLANSSTSTAARAYPAGVATALRAVATLGSNGRALITRAGVTPIVAAP